MNTPSARPEPNKRDTLNRLLSAAREQFALKGLAKTRVEDVARDAGVTKQLIYHYYGSKESLFTAVLDDASQQIMNELLELNITQLAPVEALRKMLFCCFDQYMNDPHLGALALEGMRYHEAKGSKLNSFATQSPALIDKFASILVRGTESGAFKAEIDARFLVASAALLMSGGFTNHYSMSILVGYDTRSSRGMLQWREHCTDLILASVMRQG